MLGWFFKKAGASSSTTRRSSTLHSSAGATTLSQIAEGLDSMRKSYAYLANSEHHLNVWVRECEKAIAAEDTEQARDFLARIEQEVEQEEAMLTAAFNLFKTPGKAELERNEVKKMLEYLGFPTGANDVTQLMKAVDKDGDNKVSLMEFHQYVGQMGGSYKLFEVRRRTSSADGDASAGMAPSTLRLRLLEAGIKDSEQACWRLVVPPSELHAAAMLEDCQRNAIRNIRMLSKSNHERCLPELQARIRKMNYTDDQLWMALAWIRELAPILVHLSLDKVLPFMETDTHYRNQFETATSGGLLKPATRKKWERDLFGGAYETATGFQRCKYGVLNSLNDFRGVVKCIQYGDSYLVLKNVRLRCTQSPEDSANLQANKLAVLDYYAHVFVEYNDDELRETMKVAMSSDSALMGNSEKVGKMKYKETQIHGPISYATDVERLVAHPRHRDNHVFKRRVEAVCKKHGWALSWVDQERKRMAAEEKHKLGAEAWKAKMQRIMDDVQPSSGTIPPSFCRIGCGRKVAPGLTKKGNPYSTCCRGCVMGFGHDANCGNIDPALIAPGLCRNGCGRPVNKGKRASGRRFDTCCRGCAHGEHDPSCGRGSSSSLHRVGRWCRGFSAARGHTKACLKAEG